MAETENNGRRKPYVGDMDRDLDHMLDMLAPPAPSDTLRARLKRDFEAAGAASSATAASRRERFVPRGQWGGIAVAASLVLAVALGVMAPPETSATREDAMAAVYDIEATDEAMTDAELLAASAPDSPLYMVVTYNAGITAYTEASGTATTASGTVSRVSYTDSVAGDGAYDGDVFGMMPLE